MTVLDLVLHRYGGSIEYVMSLPFGDGLRLIQRAADQTKEDRIFLQWAVQLPFMDPAHPIPFRDYMDRVTGKNLDLRPTREIIDELVEAEHQLLGGAANGT